MNRFLYISFSLFILISCSKKSTDTEQLKPTAMNCDSVIYSKIAEETYFYGSFKVKCIVKYDIYGNQVECASYNINEELCGKYITKYNSNNNLIEEIHYDSKGKLTNDRNNVARYVYTYDSLNNKIKEERYCQSNTYLGKTEYEYDKNNNLTEETKYYFYGPIESKVIYEYDSIGNTIKKIYCLNNDGKLMISDIDTLKISF